MIFKPQTFHGDRPEVEEEFPSDAGLEQRVADALATSDGISAEALKVVATGSEILIYGNVATRTEMERAVEVALAVPGVEKVSVRMESEESP